MTILKIIKKILKILLIGAVLVLIILASRPVIRVLRSENLKRPAVVFFDVGQGDAILIKTPNNKIILLDGGPDNSVLWRLGEVLPFYRRRIDLIIFSHYHDDHITGLVEVLKRYQVGDILYAPTEFSSPILKSFFEAANMQGIAPQLIAETAHLDFGLDCFMDLINPESLGIKKDENNSLSARLDCGGRSFLLTGDSNTKAEKALLSSGWPLSTSVFKAAHHGSKTANSADFFRAVNPVFLVISVGADNKFGHPYPDILVQAENFGLNVKRTDEAGSIRFYLE